jgi:hypothetical protein
MIVSAGTKEPGLPLRGQVSGRQIGKLAHNLLLGLPLRQLHLGETPLFGNIGKQFLDGLLSDRLEHGIAVGIGIRYKRHLLTPPLWSFHSSWHREVGPFPPSSSAQF